jgi:exonuclease SbcC
MIPTSLSVRNFMCYRSTVDIDLRGVRVACLSGDNGAGKSALLDCITWALWGKARVNSDRELMALNATEMEVTFGFELHNQEFRVVRRRTRGGAGPLYLDLETLDGERWRTISGATARETQRAIERLLKMDYDTFINSAFILQGRADEFTTKTPALRKQTLGEILNLSDYDRYEDLARQRLRERERLLRQIDADIERIDHRLEELPARRGEVDDLSRRLVEAVERVEEGTSRLSSVRARLQHLELAASQQSRIRQDIAALDGEISRLTQDLSSTSDRIALHQTMLARGEEIRARHVELSELRREQERIGVSLARREELLKQRRAIEVEIQRITNDVQSRLQSVRDRIEQLSRTAGSRPQLEADRARLRSDIDAATAELLRLDKLRSDRSALETRRGELTAANQQLRSEMDKLKRKLTDVEAATAVCPICQRELGPEERDRLRDEYQAEGTALGNCFRANQADIKRIDGELERNSQETQRLERLRSRVETIARQEASVLERLAACERDEAEIARLRIGEIELVGNLSRGEETSSGRTKLRQVDQQLMSVPYDEMRHRELQQRVAELNGVEQELSALLSASAAVESDRQHLAMIEQMHASRSSTRREMSEQLSALSEEVAGLDATREEHDLLSAELSRIERKRGELQESFGAAQQRVHDLEALEEERSARDVERRRAVEELTTFEELALAFGKRGIQAMIIENVVPELQDEANRILDKMPGNSMRVEFRTQRQAIASEGTIETLDIVISDEVGSRQYELYSGGEAFRVNFAIRVALSMLLARRAGARLQTLVIDEGFGTQDSRGRDGLIEAIHAVEPEFRMILVITHIPELKDLFPTRIDVVKGLEGSIVSVN